jgi:hypothetical protein
MRCAFHLLLLFVQQSFFDQFVKNRRQRGNATYLTLNGRDQGSGPDRTYGSNANDTSMTDTSTTAAADFHRPISAATGGYRRCDSLTAAAHHIRAVR